MESAPATEALTRERRILRRLATLHRVYGCLVGVLGIFLMCLLWVSAEDVDAAATVRLGPVVVPELGIIIGLIVALWAYVALLIWIGDCLGNTKHYGICIGLVCLNCLYFPVGTVLSVATLLVLPRRRYRALFRHADAHAPTDRVTETRG
jgi:hypothetical protein